MFKSYEHFKKTTQSLFVEIQNNKINKLSSRLNIANVVNETKNSGEQIINSDFIGIDNKRNFIIK